MPHSMTEVQHTPQIPFLLIARDNVGLDRSTTRNEPLHSGSVALEDLRHGGAKVLEQVASAKVAVLQSLVQAAAVFACRKCSERLNVAKNHARLVKRPDKVLHSAKVHACLPADAGIDLRQKCRGYLHNADTAHVNRCGETCH